MDTLAIIAIVFVGAVGEAALVWWLAGRSHGAHARFLQERVESQEKTISGLVDRIQAPTTQDFIKRQEAQATIVQQARVSPEQAAKAQVDYIIEKVLESEEWKKHPAFENVRTIIPKGDGSFQTVSVEEDPDSGLPFIEDLSRAEFANAFFNKPA